MRALALAALVGLAAPAEAICLRDRGPRTIDVVAELGANSDMATAIDILFVASPAALDRLPKTGPEWFASRAALIAGLGPVISIVSLQIPPGSLATVQRPRGICRPAAVLVFANMISARGTAVMTLADDGTLRVRPTDLLWTPKQP